MNPESPLIHAKHVFRAAILLLAVLVAMLLGRSLFVPETWGEYGPYRGAAVAEHRDKPIRHGGNDSCAMCHDVEYADHAAGVHASVQCELVPRPRRPPRRPRGGRDGGRDAGPPQPRAVRAVPPPAGGAPGRFPAGRCPRARPLQRRRAHGRRMFRMPRPPLTVFDDEETPWHVMTKTPPALSFRISRREFLHRSSSALAGSMVIALILPEGSSAGIDGADYDWDRHRWVYLVDTTEVHRVRLLRPRLPGRERRPGRHVPDLGRALRDSRRGRGLRRLSRRRRARVRPGRHAGSASARPSSCPSSATTATRPPAPRSARSARPSATRTASCWSTRSTASAAATASRPVRTAAASSTRQPTPPTSAPCATTASPRG